MLRFLVKVTKRKKHFPDYFCHTNNSPIIDDLFQASFHTTNYLELLSLQLINPIEKCVKSHIIQVLKEALLQKPYMKHCKRNTKACVAN